MQQELMKDTHKKIKKAWILLHNDIFIFYHFLNRIFIENCSSSCCKMRSKMRNTCNVCKISLQWSINTFSSLQNNSMLLFPKTHAVCSSEQFCVRHAGSSSSALHPALTRTRSNAGCAMAISSVRTELLKPKGSFTQPRVRTWDPSQHCEHLKDSPLSPSLGHTPEPPLHPTPPSPFTASSSSRALSALLSAYLKFKITTGWKHRVPLQCLLS